MGDQGSLIAPRGSSPAIGGNAVREPDPLKGGDVYKWAMDQVALMQAGRYNDVDWVNVADEIESVGKSEVRSLTSHIEIVLAHMLKWDHQHSRRSRSWVDSIDEHRSRVEKDLSDSPSLKSKLGGVVTDGYRFARYAAARETGLPRSSFPAECPYDWDAIMTRSFVLPQTDETA